MRFFVDAESSPQPYALARVLSGLISLPALTMAPIRRLCVMLPASYHHSKGRCRFHRKLIAPSTAAMKSRLSSASRANFSRTAIDGLPLWPVIGSRARLRFRTR